MYQMVNDYVLSTFPSTISYSYHDGKTGGAVCRNLRQRKLRGCALSIGAPDLSKAKLSRSRSRRRRIIGRSFEDETKCPAAQLRQEFAESARLERQVRQNRKALV